MTDEPGTFNPELVAALEAERFTGMPRWRIWPEQHYEEPTSAKVDKMTAQADIKLLEAEFTTAQSRRRLRAAS